MNFYYLQERSGGLTALHMAIKESCDPLLVQILLQEAERRNINVVNKGDYPGDTALHYVALRNDIAFHQQAKVVQLLILYGAVSNRCGSQGRTPLALVSAERKNVSQSRFC
jgi:ankyrin repeat protein